MFLLYRTTRNALEEAVKTGRSYRLIIPKTDDGKEAAITGGLILVEIADVVENQLVRTQRYVSVERLVRALRPDDMLDIVRRKAQADPQGSMAAHPRNALPLTVESTSRSIGSELSRNP